MLDFWYHGTNEYFEDWLHPPIQSKYKPGFFAHSFISLSRDVQLAKITANPANGLCRSLLSPSANILDLRERTPQTKQHWQQLINSELGQSHQLMSTFEGFIQSCINGEVLRMNPDEQTQKREPFRQLFALQEIVKNPGESEKSRAQAHITIQNFTRKWIETVLTPAKLNGFDAVICSEIDRYRPSGVVACTNLYVFNSDMLSKPEWLNLPDESVMQAYLQQIKQLGMDKN